MKLTSCAALILLALAACDPEPTPKDPKPFGDVELVADQGVLPPGTNGLAVLAESDEQSEKVWAHFGFEGEAPAVEAEAKVALFVGTGESGSCPIELKGVDVRESEILFETGGNEGTCTSDFRFRSFVFLFPAEEPPGIGDKVNLGGRFEIQSSKQIAGSDGSQE